MADAQDKGGAAHGQAAYKGVGLDKPAPVVFAGALDPSGCLLEPYTEAERASLAAEALDPSDCLLEPYTEAEQAGLAAEALDPLIARHPDSHPHSLQA